MKPVIACLIFLIIGFAAGRFTAPTPPNPEDLVVAESSDSSTPAEESTESGPELETKSPLSDVQVVAQSPSPSPSSVASPTESPMSEKSAPVKNWVAAEKTLAQLRAEDVPEFLKNVEIDDPMKAIQGARPPTKMDETLEFLNGNFTGRMTPLPGNRAFNIAMTAAIQMRDDKLRGRVSLKLSRRGRVFSQGANTGNIQNVQKFGEQSAGVLVTTGDYHFQLYLVPALESFEGNCYQQTGPGQLKLVGTVHLDRSS